MVGLVVFRFPALQFSGQVFFVTKILSSIELFGIRLVAPLDLAVDLRTSRRDMAMRDAEIGKMPSELRSERGIVIGLNLLDGKGKVLTNFLEEVDGCLGVVVERLARTARSGVLPEYSGLRK